MNDELGMGHRLLDRLAGDNHELQKLDKATLRKAALRAGDHKLAAAMDEAIVDHLGCVMIRETALKLARSAFYKTLPANVAQIIAPWANPGDVTAGPRGSGPAPRPPEDMPPTTPDRGNAVTAKPAMTSDGSVFQSGRHDPELAMRTLQAIIDNTRRAERRR